MFALPLGQNLVLDEVTDFIGVPPTYSRVKCANPAERSSLRPDRQMPSLWALSTAQHILSPMLNDHLAFIVQNVGKKVDVMKESGLVDKARLSILVQAGKNKLCADSWEDELDATLVSEVGKLGASLAFTVLWPTSEDDEPQ